MNIITQPSVYLLGKQLLQQAELDRFLADHGVSWESDSEVAAEVVTEASGRICYMSFAKPRPGGNAAYLHHIKEVGHGSVLEHAVWTFIFTGVSRSLLAELTRHRVGWAYSVLSQRYVDESVAEYVEPDIIAGDPELHALWLETVERTHAAYVLLAEKLNAKLTNTVGACDNPNCADGEPAEDFRIPATAVSGALSETRRKFGLTRTTGETMATELVAVAPVEVVYRGLSGTWMEGPRTRGRS